MWALADAHNGYISVFEVYTGKMGDRVEKGLGSRVVKTLCTPYKQSFRHVYFDNYFTSPNLLMDLDKMGLYGCGTLRRNRKGFPESLKKASEKGLDGRGSSKTVQYKNLSVSIWQDSKPVTLAATNTDPTVTENVQRKKKDGTRITVNAPQSVVWYNKYMGGVDHNDQMRGYYHVRLKCRKFYKYIFWFLFDITISNTYFLARAHCGLKCSLKDARVTLAKALIKTYCSRKRLGRPPVNPRRFNSNHFPVKMKIKHRCFYCTKNKLGRHEPKWYCKECDKYLCHSGGNDDCFLLYHQKYL